MGFSNKRFLGIHIFVLLWTITAAVAMLGSDSIAVKGGRRGTSMTGQPAPGGVEIEILMIDGAQIPQSVLRQAEQEASRIFREAGVEITWVKCGPSLEATCRVAPASNQFVVHIMPTGSGLRDTVFGMPFLGDNGRGRYCDVFFDPIAVEAPAWGTSTARLLGT